MKSVEELIAACAIYCTEHDLDVPPMEPTVKDVGLWLAKMIFHAEQHLDNKGAKLVIAANQAAGRELADEEGG
jgi:hypothetical protein